MSLKFQYNKTSLNDLNRQLKVREAVLPILKSKETALRIAVNRQRKLCREQQDLLREKERLTEAFLGLIGRFPVNQLEVGSLIVTEKKIAGVSVPILKELKLRIKPLLWHEAPHWYTDVFLYLQEYHHVVAETRIAEEQLSRLDNERRRTTQKVNLFEKVQIPAYQDAIKKIRKYLEDKENLSKAAQKIVKNRKMA